MTRDEGFTVVPKCNAEASTLNSFEKRANMDVKGTNAGDGCLCGPRVLAQMDPEKQPYKVIRNEISAVQFAGEGGACLIVSTRVA